jgi:C4-dicarboxylate-specific signal transduction histidine kinase
VAGVTSPAAPIPRARSRILQELGVRAAVSALIFVFNELFGIGPNPSGDSAVRTLTIVAFVLNGPYFLIAQTGWRPRVQAYLRMLVDITLLTAGLYDAGGLAAAQDVSVYVIIPVYAALMLSSTAALLATAYSTLAFLTVVFAQWMGWLPMPRLASPNALGVLTFNLLVLNVVGVLAAYLAEQYRQSRRQVRALNQELERAHHASLRLASEIQRTARLDAVGEVVASVTHELRNVLMGAISHNARLRRRLAAADPDTREHVEQIEHALDNAARIFNNVLDTARQPSRERGPVFMPEVVRRVVDLKGYDVRRDRIALRVEFPPTFPAVIASAFQLEQVLLNLVGNAHDAVKAARVEGAITIAGRVDDGHAIVEVRDNGPGIDDEVLPRIFEPFYTTKSTGTGLGLSISAGIVRDAGGQLTAANLPDGGAVFRIALPVAS